MCIQYTCQYIIPWSFYTCYSSYTRTISQSVKVTSALSPIVPDDELVPLGRTSTGGVEPVVKCILSYTIALQVFEFSIRWPDRKRDRENERTFQLSQKRDKDRERERERVRIPTRHYSLVVSRSIEISEGGPKDDTMARVSSLSTRKKNFYIPFLKKYSKNLQNN